MIKWESEAHLCSAFIEKAKNAGLAVYPETGGFDIVLVHRSGWQIGVEAKVRANFHVICQALPKLQGSKTGPDYRAVLVPTVPRNGFRMICDRLRIVVFDMNRISGFDFYYFPEYLSWTPNKRIKLPEFVPRVPSGVPSPIKLTDWKIKALKLIALAEVNGAITSKDTKLLDINFAFVAKKWMEKTGKKDGRYFLWQLRKGDGSRPDRQHPEVYREIVKQTQKRLKDEK